MQSNTCSVEDWKHGSEMLENWLTFSQYPNTGENEMIASIKWFKFAANYYPWFVFHGCFLCSDRWQLILNFQEIFWWNLLQTISYALIPSQVFSSLIWCLWLGEFPVTLKLQNCSLWLSWGNSKIESDVQVKELWSCVLDCGVTSETFYEFFLWYSSHAAAQTSLPALWGDIVLCLLTVAILVGWQLRHF